MSASSLWSLSCQKYQIVARTGTNQEIGALAGIHFFDAWRVKPRCEALVQLPVTNDGPSDGVSHLINPCIILILLHGTSSPQRKVVPWN